MTDTVDEVHLHLRAQLIGALCDVIQADGLRQREAAALFGVAQPRVSDLVRGKVELFSIDTLVDMLAAAGVEVGLVLHRHRRPRRGAGGTGRRRRRPAAARRGRGGQGSTDGG